MKRFIWERVADWTDLERNETVLRSDDGGKSGLLYGVMAVTDSTLTGMPIHEIDEEGRITPAKDQKSIDFYITNPAVLNAFYHEVEGPSGSAFVDLPVDFVKRIVSDFRNPEDNLAQSL